MLKIRRSFAEVWVISFSGVKSSCSQGLVAYTTKCAAWISLVNTDAPEPFLRQIRLVFSRPCINHTSAGSESRCFPSGAPRVAPRYLTVSPDSTCLDRVCSPIALTVLPSRFFPHLATLYRLSLADSHATSVFRRFLKSPEHVAARLSARRLATQRCRVSTVRPRPILSISRILGRELHHGLFDFLGYSILHMRFRATDFAQACFAVSGVKLSKTVKAVP